MKMKRKIFFTMITAVSLFILGACGNATTSQTKEKNEGLTLPARSSSETSSNFLYFWDFDVHVINTKTLQVETTPSELETAVQTINSWNSPVSMVVSSDGRTTLFGEYNRDNLLYKGFVFDKNYKLIDTIGLETSQNTNVNNNENNFYSLDNRNIVYADNLDKISRDTVDKVNNRENVNQDTASDHRPDFLDKNTYYLDTVGVKKIDSGKIIVSSDHIVGPDYRNSQKEYEQGDGGASGERPKYYIKDSFEMPVGKIGLLGKQMQGLDFWLGAINEDKAVLVDDGNMKAGIFLFDLSKNTNKSITSAGNVIPLGSEFAIVQSDDIGRPSSVTLYNFDGKPLKSASIRN